MPPFAQLRLLYLRRVVGTAIGAAGIERAMRWGRWLARRIFELNPPPRARVVANLTAAYGEALSPEQRERLARAVFENVACFWVEVAYARRRLTPGAWRRCVRLVDDARWATLTARPGPALFVSTHFGNPAVAVYAIGQLCQPVHVVFDAFEMPLLRRWQDELYRHRNVQLISRTEAAAALPDILAAGGKIVLLGTHLRPHGRGVNISFLGRTRSFYPTIGLLAARHAAPVVVFSNTRTATPFQFELRCEKIIEPVGEPDEITAATVAAMERMIHAAPHQYLWTRL